MQQGNPTSMRVPDPGVATLFEQDARWQAWLDVEAALAKGEADRSANTTPGNKKGGLSNIVEKSLGSIVNSFLKG